MSLHQAIDVGSATPLKPAIPGWPRLLSAEMASSYMGISQRNFLDRVKRHMLPAPVKVGERVLWDIRSLDNFVDTLVGLEPAVVEENCKDW